MIPLPRLIRIAQITHRDASSNSVDLKMVSTDSSQHIASIGCEDV